MGSLAQSRRAGEVVVDEVETSVEREEEEPP
jgi:hypothetical protein